MKTIIDNAIQNLQKVKDNFIDGKKYPSIIVDKVLDLSSLINALVIAVKENSFEENEKNERRYFSC